MVLKQPNFSNSSSSSPMKVMSWYVKQLAWYCCVSYIFVFILVPTLLLFKFPPPVIVQHYYASSQLLLLHLYKQGITTLPYAAAAEAFFSSTPPQFIIMMIIFCACACACAFGYLIIISSRPRAVYLVDYACYKPPANHRVPFATFMEHSQLVFPTHPKTIYFQKQILERSGLGERTCVPPAIHYIPPTPTLKLAREEAQTVIFSVMDQLLAKTQLNPKHIDILIVNCSMFSPTPSLSAMIVNKYKLRSNVKSFNLSGMGCSAGLISIDLARDLLQTHRNSNAVIVSTEIITPNSYLGKERSMLLPNCLFRTGGAALLLSNRRVDGERAKYRLLHVVRTHMGNKDKSYKCVFQQEDEEGFVGINLCINLMEVAGEALKSNITSIGPLVLPVWELVMFVVGVVRGKLMSSKSQSSSPNNNKKVPDFKRAFEHFCIHAGGRAVIDELQKNLELSGEHVEASRMTLHRFGNTSSSSLWYEMSYIEAKGRMKRGDRVWQIAFGSGFKCNSAVWKCNRTIHPPVLDTPWADCIHQYPVYIPDILKV
ncbi:PREDICTED: 3-ketoacyl-CoA synthase 5-like [Ipomoea nil]|uniref:3-ketoacyl-CoA synthase 5-like n=1 Tax=Ipomoea nil TaxID=35883 RepID=UPI00090103B5|nr:PREDICTED: 3-ketoacyl-CoA synthase 5-like [Ipomoea nil]